MKDLISNYEFIVGGNAEETLAEETEVTEEAKKKKPVLGATEECLADAPAPEMLPTA